jgi:hypothetical protein
MSELESVKRALADAVEQAAGAAELARLLVDYQRRLDEAAHAEAEALTRLREVEARLKTAERQNAKLAKHLAEQRYQTEVANWRLASVQESRWAKLGDALHSKNPGTVARTLKEPVMKRPAPRRSDFRPEPPEVPAEKAPAVAPDPKAPDVSSPMAEGFAVPKGPLARPYLTVAAIVDRRTEALLRYEWRQVTNFGPENWAAMLEQHEPHVLFVESVRPGPRQGNGGRWLEALAGETRALRDLIEGCRKRGVRTVFWHSGGPVSRFVPAAELFEQVLTTTEARVREWRAALRHDRVGVLPHGVQPRVHNPIPAVGGRTGEIVTLGTVELPKAARDVQGASPPAAETDSVTSPVSPVPSGSTPAAATAANSVDAAVDAAVPIAPERAAADPATWVPLAGQGDDPASYDDVLTAYRRPAIVVAGPDADGRVLAEIAACGTPVVRIAAKGQDPVPDVEALLDDPERRAGEAHLAWRLTESVTPALDPILDAMGVASVRNIGAISAVAAVGGEAELRLLLDRFARQTHRPGQLVVVADGVDVETVEKAAGQMWPAGTGDGDVDLVVRGCDTPVTRGAGLDRALRLADGDYVAVFDPRDVYGEHYLADLVRHFGSTDAEIVGKASFYAHLPTSGATLLRQPGAEHRFLAEVAGGTLLARRQTLTDLGVADISEDWDEVLMRQCRAEGVRVYSADRYSYVCVRDAGEGRLLGSARFEGYVAAEPLALISPAAP